MVVCTLKLLKKSETERERVREARRGCEDSARALKREDDKDYPLAGQVDLDR